uniref:LITAF domain-containing protein n=1 Tax=Elaeophora elaphi TaxID=1147741 RepID=A0A0R3S083_9BILA
MTESSSPPPYNSPPPYPTTEHAEMLQQSQDPLSQCLQKCSAQTSISSTVQSLAPMEPIIMPIMMPQASSYPYQQQQPVSDNKPVNVVINANNGKDERDSFARDYRICNFCKRGIMNKKKDWLRVIAIVLVSVLCPPLSFLCCFLLCTHVIYYAECSTCHRISKRKHR